MRKQTFILLTIRRKGAERDTNGYFTSLRKTVATKVGTEFIKIVKEEFPPDHPYHHILNEHTVKFSYSVMPNLKKKINNHNAKITKKEDDNKNGNNSDDREEDDYDPEEDINYDELEEIVSDAAPIVEDPGTQSSEPVTYDAKACNDCDDECGIVAD